MRTIAHTTPASFLDATEALRRTQRLLANTITTNAGSRASGLMPTDDRDLWLHVEDDRGEVVGCAIRTYPRALLVSELPDGAADALATHLAAIVGDLSGLDGPRGTVLRMADRFAQLTGAEVTHGIDMRVLATSTIDAPAGVPGESRPPAGDAERDLIVAWAIEFTHEAVPGSPPPDPDALVRSMAVLPPAYALWVVDGVPRSLCWQSVPADGVVRISAVYTPPDQRGRGYAAANVASVSQRALDAGAHTCMLFTDRSNPTSNRVYERIGYRFVADALEVHLTAPR
jgi:GNAT superfamily N-acetyltransferase